MIQFFQNIQVELFTAFIAPIIVNILWKSAAGAKAKASGDVDKILNRYPKVGLVAHDLLSEAKTVINPDDTDKLISYVANGLKAAIKGPWDDIVIDAIVKKIVESRVHP